jgi:hypothetical protein
VSHHTFTARYEGVCVLCPIPIEPGDLLQTTADDEAAHAECAAAARRDAAALAAMREPRVCPAHHMAVPCEYCEDADA